MSSLLFDICMFKFGYVLQCVFNFEYVFQCVFNLEYVIQCGYFLCMFSCYRRCQIECQNIFSEKMSGKLSEYVF